MVTNTKFIITGRLDIHYSGHWVVLVSCDYMDSLILVVRRSANN